MTTKNNKAKNTTARKNNSKKEEKFEMTAEMKKNLEDVANGKKSVKDVLLKTDSKKENKEKKIFFDTLMSKKKEFEKLDKKVRFSDFQNTVKYQQIFTDENNVEKSDIAENKKHIENGIKISSRTNRLTEKSLNAFLIKKSLILAISENAILDYLKKEKVENVKTVVFNNSLYLVNDKNKSVVEVFSLRKDTKKMQTLKNAFYTTIGILESTVSENMKAYLKKLSVTESFSKSS